MQRAKKESGELGSVDVVGETFLQFINRLITRRWDLRIEKYPPAGGDMTFSIPLSDVGYTNRELDALRQMLRRRFYADFIAEWILRRNFQRFLEHVAEETLYAIDVRIAIHEHFGVAFDRGRLLFTFHMSKLAAIANEELTEVLS